MERREDTESTIDLLKLARLLWHNAVVIIAVTLASAALGLCAATFLISPTYSASADMLVNNTQQDTANTSITYSDLSASSSLVDTYSIILKSHNVLEQVIADLNLDCSYESLAGKITVSAVDTTQVMRITVKDGDVDLALAIVTKIVELAPDAIMDTVSAGSVKTVDDPWTTGRPVSPSKRNYTAIAGLLGLVVCAGIILLQEMMDNTFKTEEDVRKVLGLPVLGVIPLEDKNAGKGGAH